jgi:hypothetical protein
MNCEDKERLAQEYAAATEKFAGTVVQIQQKNRDLDTDRI